MGFACLAKEFPAVKASSRTKICAGEEATVFRINKTSNPFFRALAERNGIAERRPVQDGSGERILKYIWSEQEGASTEYVSGEVYWQMLNFYSMRLANVLFPQNFPKVHALRFCIGQDKKIGARLYTEFVPDENGALARKIDTLKKYRRLSSAGEEWESLRDAADTIERLSCGGLEDAAKRVRAAGLMMYHPEMNYHERDGVPVFFEVDGIVLKELVEHICGMPESRQKTRAKAAFAMLLGAIIFAEWEAFDEFDKMSLAYTGEFNNWSIYHLYFEGEPAIFARHLVDACLGNREVASSLDFYKNENEGYRRFLDSAIDDRFCLPQIVEELAHAKYDVWDFMEKSHYFWVDHPANAPEAAVAKTSFWTLKTNAREVVEDALEAVGAVPEAVGAKIGFWKEALGTAKRVVERSLQAVRQQI